MGWKTKVCCFFAMLSASLCADQENTLEHACGYEGLSSKHISQLDSWSGSKKIGIGVNSNTDNGLYVKNFTDDSVHHLRDIAFENNEFSSSRELIVEREGISKAIGPSRQDR